MIKLYEIPQEVRIALNQVQIDEETGEILGLEKIKELDGEAREKILSTACYIQELKEEQELLAKQIVRLTGRKNSVAKRIESLKALSIEALNAINESKLKNPQITVYIRKSQSVQIDDIDAIPDGFKEEQVQIVVDKTLLGKELKEGVCVSGASLLEKQNLMIR